MIYGLSQIAKLGQDDPEAPAMIKVFSEAIPKLINHAISKMDIAQCHSYLDQLIVLLYWVKTGKHLNDEQK